MLVMLFAVVAAWAQMQDPTHFRVSQKQVSPTEVEVIFSGTIEKGWHVYSTGLADDGPISATVTTEKAEGAKPKGKLIPKGKEINTFDKVFEQNLRYFENSVQFVQKYEITGKTYHIKGFLEYGCCNDEMCMPPGNVEFDYQGKGPEDAPEAEEETAEEEKTDTAAVVPLMGDSIAADTTGVATTDLWKPVIKELQAYNGDDNQDR